MGGKEKVKQETSRLREAEHARMRVEREKVEDCRVEVKECDG
jgi:hypothetical protein